MTGDKPPAVSHDDVAHFRDTVRESPMRRYDRLTSADRWHLGTRHRAEATLAGCWSWKGRPGVSLAAPVDWKGICGEDRSWHLALHAWEFLAPVLSMHDQTGDTPCFEFALSLATDWLHHFRSVDCDDPFAWYDLAVGSRAYRLAYLLDVVARDENQSDECVSRLLAGLGLHATALADEARFARHSNHAFYQIMGQLAFGRRFPHLDEAMDAERLGHDRLHDLLAGQFTADGGHREHSPHYHDLVLIPLRALRKSGLVDDQSVTEICHRAEDGLSWFVSPAGHYVMFGDTAFQPATAGDRPAISANSLRFALSGGRMGTPPDDPISRGLPDSGYVIFRDRWPNGGSDFADCAYLAQTCAFHSRVHKHADDLSFVWYDRGCEILTDAGRFGYVGKTNPDSELFAEGFWYSDPRRIYVESTRAHNTVEVDHRSNPRRGVEPYGSALTQWGERGGVRFSESRVDWGELSHTRLLFFFPRAWVLVIDSLLDFEGRTHDFTQRFHLAPELEISQGGEADSVTAELPSGDQLHAIPLLSQALVEPVRGVEDPELLGWISRRDGELEPQWTFAWESVEVASQTFASLLCFADRRPRVDGIANCISSDATSARLTWDIDGEPRVLSFERVPGQAFEIEYREPETEEP